MSCDCSSLPCDCDPNVVVGASDISLLGQYLALIQEFVESPGLTTTTPGGREIDTLSGALTKVGYQPPIPYTAGIVFGVSDQTKTVEESGVVYAPLPSALPFTTSGTFVGDDDARFFTIQSVDLYSGDVVISKPTVADMAADANLQLGNIVQTEGYLASNDLGAAVYRIVAAATGTPDGGLFIDLAASGLQAQAVLDSDRINVAQFGAVGNGGIDDSAAIQAAVDALSALGGGELEFPLTGGGIFRCNFELKPAVSLRGASRDVTLVPAQNAPIINLQPDANVQRVTIRELTLDGTGTQGTFIAQDGIRLAPDATFQHASVTIEDCFIRNCGAAGVAVVGAEVGANEQVNLLRINRCRIEGCTGPGWSVEGMCNTAAVTGCDINDNGDGADNLPNILLRPVGVTATFPQNVTLTENSFNTQSYVSGGTVISILGAFDINIVANRFDEFHTGVKVQGADNGVITMLNNSFNRSAGDIDACVEILQVDGFIYDGNNVTAPTTGPVGIIFPNSAADARRISLGGTNSYGSLTQASQRLPRVIIGTADTILNLPQTNGPVVANLDANGAASVQTLADFNGGVQQFVDGDTINLSIADAARTLTLEHATGNIRLAGGANFTLDEVGDNITLKWNQSLSPAQWVETSRVTLT